MKKYNVTLHKRSGTAYCVVWADGILDAIPAAERMEDRNDPCAGGIMIEQDGKFCAARHFGQWEVKQAALDEPLRSYRIIFT